MNKLAIFNDNQQENIPDKHGLVQNLKGRGSSSNRTGRYEKKIRNFTDDGWLGHKEFKSQTNIKTTLTKDKSKTIIVYNTSPDISFDRSINPYRGCEHGCIYCFARPTHAFLGLSSGLDFETQLFYKPKAAKLLKKELTETSYTCRTISMGTNTDPYQPVEKQLRLTRSILEVLYDFKHPVSIVTKSSLITRDLDILRKMAEKRLVKVCLSITTLSHSLANKLEPRAPTPMKRLATIKALVDAGIPCSTIIAPVIPALNDHELENIMEASRNAGAKMVTYILLRLPHEVADLFREWLKIHEPNRADRVMNILAGTRGGTAYQSAFGERMTETGKYATIIQNRFNLASKKFRFNCADEVLDTSQFADPIYNDEQLSFF